MASMPAASAASSKIWIPIDVKTRWFSFLGVPDLANCQRVCKAWSSLVSKTADAEIATITCATPPTLSRAGKLKFLHRLHFAYQPENMGYLLAWAAGSREYTPFLHKLLLLRDCIREDLGLPGGLHESARPEAFDELDDSVKALWGYRYTLPASGYNPPSTVEVVPLGPLVVAASRGNADALHLLLLFGEGVHPRRKGNEKALYAAVEQGNIACVAALLGRVPLRPPAHPPHIAKRLGLVRPTWSIWGPGMVYAAGVALGPYDVPAAISAAKIRAELAAASGMATQQGTKASATAAARAKALVSGPGAAGSALSSVEVMVAQQQVFENDGRYRGWCSGYHMGTYWYLYDTSLANYENIHGMIGIEPEKVEKGTAAEAAEGSSGLSRASALVALNSPAQRSLYAAQRITVTLFNLEERLSSSVAPGTTGPLITVKKRKDGVTPAYAAQALLVSRLPANVLLSAASQPRRRGVIHPALPAAVHYGKIAADAIAIKVRINVGPQDGRTPLLAACERGRTEIAYLLLSHHNPSLARTGEVPELLARLEGGDEATNAAPPQQGAAAPQPAQPAPAQQAAPTAATPSAAANARAALAAIASAKSSALAVAFESAQGSESRRAEVFMELMQEERDRADVDAAPTGHHTPLCLACDRGDDRMVALLLHWGANVNKEGRKEARPLLVACMAGHEHLVRLLLRSSCAYEAAKAVASAIADLAASRGEAEPALVQLFPVAGMGERDRSRSRGRTRSRAPLRVSGDYPASSPMGDGDEAFAADDVADGEGGGMRDTIEMLGLTNAVRAGTRSQSHSRSQSGAQAASALGSMIASQTRKTGGRRQLRKPEDPAIDVCEPTVVTTLLLAAAEAVGDEAGGAAATVVVPGSASAVLPSGFTYNMYLPADEANMTTGPSYRFGLFNPNIRRQASGGAGMGRLAHARSASGSAPLNEIVDTNVEAMLQNGTGSTYGSLLDTVESFRFLSRSEINNLLTVSRAINGLGMLPGREVLDINLGDESGYTSLFIAASTGKLDSVVLLLAAGADGTIPTKRGKTPIYGAVEKCNVEIVESLLPRYTAHQLRANTTYGTNVMHAANKAGNNRIKEMLNQYCIDWDTRESRRNREAQAAKRWAGDPSKILSAEEKARKQDAYMKRMLGLTQDEDEDVADPLESAQVSSQIEKIRRMAEAARRKEEEMELRRRERERIAEEEGTGGGGGPRKARSGGVVATSVAAFDSAALSPSPHASAATARGRSEVRTSADNRNPSKSVLRASSRSNAPQARAHTASQGPPRKPAGGLPPKTLISTRSFRVSEDADVDLKADSKEDDAVDVAEMLNENAASRPPKAGVVGHLRSITTVRQALPVAPRIIPSPLTVPDVAESKSEVEAEGKHQETSRVPQSPLGARKEYASESKWDLPAPDAEKPSSEKTASSGTSRSIITAPQAATQPLGARPPHASASDPSSDHASAFDRLAARAKQLDRGQQPAAEQPPRNRRNSGLSASGKQEDSMDDEPEWNKYRMPPANKPGSRPPSADLDTSFGLDKPKATKYAGASVAEIRATAREQVKEEAPGVHGPSAEFIKPANDNDVRAKRAAFYERLRKGDATNSTSAATSTAAQAVPDIFNVARAPSSASTVSTMDERPSLLSGTGLRDKDISPLQAGTRPTVPAWNDADDLLSSVAQLRKLVREKETNKTSPVSIPLAGSTARPGVGAPSTVQPGVRASTEKLASTSINDVLQRTAPGLASILNKLEAWNDTHAPPMYKGPDYVSPVKANASHLGKAPLISTSQDILDEYSPGMRRRGGAPPQASSAPGSPASEPSRARADFRSDARPPLKPREIFVDNVSAPSAHALPGSTVAAKRSDDKRKPVSAKAVLGNSSFETSPSAGVSLGIGGFAIGPGAAQRTVGDPFGRPTATRVTPDELASRDQRNQMREIQKALRQAARKEEEERRAREAVETVSVSTPSATGSLALAAAAYGAPVLKKQTSKLRR